MPPPPTKDDWWPDIPFYAFVWPKRVELPDNAKEGTLVAWVVFITPNWRLFRGTFSSTGPLTIRYNRRDNLASLVLSRALTPADDGSHQWGLSFVDTDGLTATANLAVTIQAVAPPPPPPVTMTVTLAENMVTLPDNSPSGTVLTQVTITRSDGKVFAGTVGGTDEGGNVVPIELA